MKHPPQKTDDRRVRRTALPLGIAGGVASVTPGMQGVAGLVPAPREIISPGGASVLLMKDSRGRHAPKAEEHAY